jgi:hypothetical protein
VFYFLSWICRDYEEKTSNDADVLAIFLFFPRSARAHTFLYIPHLESCGGLAWHFEVMMQCNKSEPFFLLGRSFLPTQAWEGD